MKQSKDLGMSKNIEMGRLEDRLDQGWSLPPLETHFEWGDSLDRDSAMNPTTKKNLELNKNLTQA